MGFLIDWFFLAKKCDNIQMTMKPVEYVRYLLNEDSTVLCYDTKYFTAKLNTSKGKKTCYAVVLSQEEPSGSH